MSSFALRRGAFGSVKTTGVDRTSEFKQLVEDVYRTGDVHEQVTPSDVNHVLGIGRTVGYMSGLFTNVGNQLKEFSTALRKNSMHSVSSSKIDQMTEDLSRKLNDLGQGLDKLEKAIADQSNMLTPSVLEHYNIMSNSFRNQLMEFSRTFGKLLDQHQKSEIRRIERTKLFNYRDPQEMEQGFDDGEEDARDATSQLQSESHRTRIDGMQTVQKALYEVSQLFNRVSTMVAQQNEYVESIYSDVNDASWNFAAGESELKKYLHNISSSKWLILKIFAVIIFFVIFFILFIM